MKFLYVLAAFCLVAGTPPARAEEDVHLEIARLQAVNTVQNLLSTYSFLHTSGFNHKVPDLFTKTDDTVIEMMWGRYTGKDAAYRCYFVDHRRDDQNTIDALGLKVAPVTAPKSDLAGAATGGGPASEAPFHMHLLTTPVIVVAGDGQTARGVWISPGVEGSGWGWMKYAADFKQEKGVWKIWHMHVYGLFMTPYDHSWTENPKKDAPTTPGQSADKAPTTNWEYYKGAKFVPLEPAPPKPYEHWGEPSMSPASYGSTK